MSDRRRKAVIESLSVYREFIAAGFRSPELVERTLTRLPRESREVVKRFTADFDRLLTACDMQQGSNSPIGERSQSPISRLKQQSFKQQASAAATAGKNDRSAFKAFRTAMLGSRPSPPDVTGIDTFIPTTAHRAGLIHGDVSAINQFLNTYPAVERFLAKQLVDVEDLFAFGEDESTAVLETADSLRIKAADAASGDALDDGDAMDVGGVALTVMDAFAQASMLWTQTHPVDLSALARDRAAALNSTARTAPPKFEDVQNMLLKCNLELRFPNKETWELLLLTRDAARQELAVLDEEVAVSEGGADVTSEVLSAATRGRLRIAISNCRDGLMNIGASSTPTQVKETITMRLTHLLADVTSIVHDAGIVLGASGATIAPAAPVKQSLLQRLQNKKTDVKPDEQLDEVGKQAYTISQTAKRHIKFLMQSASSPSTAVAEMNPPED